MVDVDRLVRARHAILASASALPKGQEAVSGMAFTTTFNRLRTEVRGALPEGLRDEFDRLFPEFEKTTFGQRDLFGQASAANDAQLRLASMAGWLDGVIATEGDG